MSDFKHPLGWDECALLGILILLSPLLVAWELVRKAAWRLHALLPHVRRRWREMESRAREAFKPHLFVACEREVPSPIFMVAILGDATFRRVDLPETIASVPWEDQLTQVRAAIRSHHADKRGSGGPYGRIRNYVYYPSYDEGIRFSPQGNLLGYGVGPPKLFVCSIQGGPNLLNGKAGG